MTTAKFIKWFVLSIFLVSIFSVTSFADDADNPKFYKEIHPQRAEEKELLMQYKSVINSDNVTYNEIVNLILNDPKAYKFVGVKVKIQDTKFYEHTDMRHFDKHSNISPLGLCYAPIWRAGKVKWNFPNPGQNGARYSVLPESGGTLIWANPPEQDIDGIYRASWGSCRAFKIPNGSTATFHSPSSWNVCYNVFACHVLGKCPKWVNPCDNSSPEGSWPDHPLQ